MDERHALALGIAVAALLFAVIALALAGVVIRELRRPSPTAELRKVGEAMMSELGPYTSYVRCLDVCPSGPGYLYRCTKPVDHDGQHGYAGVFWPQVES